VTPDALAAADRLNDLFGRTYEEYRRTVLATLPAILLVRSTPGGGHYALHHRGTVRVAEPVPAAFRLLKSIAHGPTLLGVLARPDGAPGEGARRRAELRDACVAARSSLDAVPLTPTARAAATIALVGTVEAIDQAHEGPLSAELRNACETMIREAGAIQAHACRDLLHGWLGDLPAADRDVLHAIVGTGWGVREHGTHFELLCHVLGRELLNVRLFAAMGEHDDERLLRRLGMILCNRRTSGAVLGDPARMDVELIGDAVAGALCPMRRSA